MLSFEDKFFIFSNFILYKMKQNIIIVIVLIILIVFTVIQTIQVYDLKKTFDDISKLNINQGTANKLTNVEKSQKQEIPEPLKEVPSIAQGCFS